MNGNPFSIDDFSCLSYEGISLHDEISVFFREIMQLSTPLKYLPSTSDVTNAFNKITMENVRFWQLKIDLQATKLDDLWVCIDKPPCSQVGIAWQVVQEIKTPDSGRKKMNNVFLNS